MRLSLRAAMLGLTRHQRIGSRSLGFKLLHQRLMRSPRSPLLLSLPLLMKMNAGTRLLLEETQEYFLERKSSCCAPPSSIQILMPISHNINSNVSGVPGGFARRYGSQQLAEAAYEEALDNGEVIQVAYIMSKRVLSRSVGK